jgi:hypothetical protein
MGTPRHVFLFLFGGRAARDFAPPPFNRGTSPGGIVFVSLLDFLAHLIFSFFFLALK